MQCEIRELPAGGEPHRCYRGRQRHADEHQLHLQHVRHSRAGCGHTASTDPGDDVTGSPGRLRKFLRALLTCPTCYNNFGVQSHTVLVCSVHAHWFFSCVHTAWGRCTLCLYCGQTRQAVLWSQCGCLGPPVLSSGALALLHLWGCNTKEVHLCSLAWVSRNLCHASGDRGESETFSLCNTEARMHAGGVCGGGCTCTNHLPHCQWLLLRRCRSSRCELTAHIDALQPLECVPVRRDAGGHRPEAAVARGSSVGAWGGLMRCHGEHALWVQPWHRRRGPWDQPSGAHIHLDTYIRLSDTNLTTRYKEGPRVHSTHSCMRISS